MTKLFNRLIKLGYLKTDSIIEAFSQINRADFIPEDLEKEAEANIPLPIGYGQTISQPLTVAFMLELLDPRPGHVVLDVGSGSGWTTALLSHIVGKEGKVIAVERIPELYEFGRKNLENYGLIKKEIAEVYNVDGTKGYSRLAPYDRILVSAATGEIPAALKGVFLQHADEVFGFRAHDTATRPVLRRSAFLFRLLQTEFLERCGAAPRLRVVRFHDPRPQVGAAHIPSGRFA